MKFFSRYFLVFLFIGALIISVDAIKDKYRVKQTKLTKSKTVEVDSSVLSPMQHLLSPEQILLETSKELKKSSLFAAKPMVEDGTVTTDEQTTEGAGSQGELSGLVEANYTDLLNPNKTLSDYQPRLDDIYLTNLFHHCHFRDLD